MNTHMPLGRSMTLLIYFLEGVIVLFFGALLPGFSRAGYYAFVVYWLVSLLLLQFNPFLTLRHIQIYGFQEIFSFMIIGVWVMLVFQNALLLLLSVFVVWMLNLLFLHKQICVTLFLIHSTTFILFTVLPPFRGIYFNYVECTIIVISLLLATWIGESLTAEADYRRRINEEQAQGLDDMLHLVRAKYHDAKVANDSKSSFLANMSHEIRTPINAVLGLDTMILRETHEESIRKYALNISSAGNSLLSIINDILDFSKIESGKMSLIPVEYDLANVISDLSNIIQMRLENKGLDLEIVVDPELPSMYRGDEVRIRQVLTNLLTNAAKYTNIGKVTLEVSGYAAGKVAFLHFSVKDTGIGIKPEDLDKLFSKFVRIEENRNRTIEGTGLGINIVTSFLQMMGSELEVDSVYGVGSNFHFELIQPIVNNEPIGDVAARIENQKKQFEYNVSFIAPDARVLVVDDNPINLNVFSALLKATELKIDQASNGMEALGKTKKNLYHLIFMDHMMPEMDGIETFSRIRRDETSPNHETPVVILTANAISGAKDMYLDMGFDAFLSKPINADKLEETIRTLLPQELVLPAPERTGKSNISNAEDLESLPAIEGVDWHYGYLHTQNIELLKTTVGTFHQMIDSEADYLQRCYSQVLSSGDKETALNDFRIKVHAMKSSATLFGALPLAGTAAMLEYAARDENLPLLRNVTPFFLEQWRGYKVKLKEFSTSESEASADITDTEEVVAYIEKLVNTISAFDVHGADEALAKLKEYKYSDELAALLEKISAAVMSLDPDLVSALADEMTAKVRR